MTPETEEVPGKTAQSDSDEAAPANSAGPDAIRDEVIAQLKTVFDPEIPVNIYELGLIYGLDVDEGTGKAHVRMTLTSPACPVAGTLPGDVELRVKDVDGVEDCEVELVWEPPWSKDLLSEEAKLQLGLL